MVVMGILVNSSYAIDGAKCRIGCSCRSDETKQQPVVVVAVAAVDSHWSSRRRHCFGYYYWFDAAGKNAG